MDSPAKSCPPALLASLSNYSDRRRFELAGVYLNLICQIVVKGFWRSSSAISICGVIALYTILCDWHETGILFIYPSNWRQVSPHTLAGHFALFA